MSVNDEFKIAGARVHVLVSSRETGGGFTICQVDAPASGGPPLHSHSYEDGFFFILDGDFQFQIGGKDVDAPRGTSLFIPCGTPYAFRNQGSGLGRFLLLAQPGGMDLFFSDVSALTRGGAPLELATLAPILEKHGIVIPATPSC